jgi:hypothetical protein
VQTHLAATFQARIAQDSLIWKPPGAGPVAFHQDAPYISAQFVPFQNNSITIWCALDDADADTGVVEYARGSHLWQAADAADGSEKGLSFHGSSGAAYQLPLQKAAAAAGVVEGDVDIVRLNVPAGVSRLFSSLLFSSSKGTSHAGRGAWWGGWEAAGEVGGRQQVGWVGGSR